jgi:hypothetical protein
VWRLIPYSENTEDGTVSKGVSLISDGNSRIAFKDMLEDGQSLEREFMDTLKDGRITGDHGQTKGDESGETKLKDTLRKEWEPKTLT